MRIRIGILGIVAVFLIIACASDSGQEFRAGRYAGYSWRGEAGGTEFADATNYIETILEIDENGTITEATMWFWVTKDGYWISRQSGNAYVEADFAVEPSPATPGSDYAAGSSMFTIYTADMMSFYATAVSASGTIAVAIVDPMTRYQMEMRLEPGFDFDTRMGDVTVDSGLMIPTVRTSGSGYLKPDDFAEIAGRSIFSIHDEYSHVVNDSGELAGVDDSSSVREFLEALGVEFAGDRAVEARPSYGYFGLGGWKGNYDAISNYLVGRDATETTSLVPWNVEKFANGVNDDNQFGVDVGTGATKTAQWSVDGISGATVRMSRESTSYQRALVQAGILTEDDVIIGRF